jgi:uncharacterized protein (DUF488 family)
MKKMRFTTIGHSTRAIGEFLSLLESNKIEAIADVRAFPSSSKYPQYNRGNLEASLARAGIVYRWMGKELGGYRKKSEGLGEESPNTGWDTGGFRIYADHMISDTFHAGIKKLLELGKGKVTAYMCAEKFYWRCHRRLISDYLVRLGHEVWHVIDKGNLREHSLTSFARIKDGLLIYPSKQELLSFPSQDK